MKTFLFFISMMACLPCVAQVQLTDSLKNKICFDTFGEEIGEIMVDENGNELSSVLFPDNMISISSYFTNQIWSDDNHFTTLKYDLLRISAVSRDISLCIVIDKELIIFNIPYNFKIQNNYKIAIRHMIRILKKHRLPPSLFSLYCVYLTKAYIQNRFKLDPESAIEKEYRPYLSRIANFK